MSGSMHLVGNREAGSILRTVWIVGESHLTGTGAYSLDIGSNNVPFTLSVNMAKVTSL